MEIKKHLKVRRGFIYALFLTLFAVVLYVGDKRITTLKHQLFVKTWHQENTQLLVTAYKDLFEERDAETLLLYAQNTELATKAATHQQIWQYTEQENLLLYNLNNRLTVELTKANMHCKKLYVVPHEKRKEYGL